MLDVASNPEFQYQSNIYIYTFISYKTAPIFGTMPVKTICSPDGSEHSLSVIDIGATTKVLRAYLNNPSSTLRLLVPDLA